MCVTTQNCNDIFGASFVSDLKTKLTNKNTFWVLHWLPKNRFGDQND